MRFAAGAIFVYAEDFPKETAYFINELNELIVAVAEMITTFCKIFAAVVTNSVVIFVGVLALPIGGNGVVFIVNGYCDFFAVIDLNRKQPPLRTAEKC